MIKYYGCSENKKILWLFGFLTNYLVYQNETFFKGLIVMYYQHKMIYIINQL